MKTAFELPQIIARNFALSLAVEPLANKEECTTRYKDSSPNTKLEYFIISGINIMWPIYEMATNTLKKGEQLDSIFLYAEKAQKASVLNRKGGRVTFGQTMLFIPYLASQLNSILDGNSITDVDSVPKYIEPTLKNTGLKDVENLENFCWAAISQSKKSNLEHGISRVQPNPRFIGLFTNFWEACSEKHLHKLFIIQEIQNSYSKIMYYVNNWDNSINKNLLRYSEEIYPELKKEFQRFDVAADLISMIFYILLCKHDNYIFFD